MSDIDAPSGLRERLTELEAHLLQARNGKKPRPQVDLMTWVPTPPRTGAQRAARMLDTIKQSLRDDWKGLNEAIARWTTRIDEHFAGH